GPESCDRVGRLRLRHLRGIGHGCGERRVGETPVAEGRGGPRHRPTLGPIASERLTDSTTRGLAAAARGRRRGAPFASEGVNESTPRMTGRGVSGERRSLPPTLTAEGVNESTPRVTGGGWRGERRSLPPTLT